MLHLPPINPSPKHVDMNSRHQTRLLPSSGLTIDTRNTNIPGAQALTPHLRREPFHIVPPPKHKWSSTPDFDTVDAVLSPKYEQDAGANQVGSLFQLQKSRLGSVGRDIVHSPNFESGSAFSYGIKRVQPMINMPYDVNNYSAASPTYHSRLLRESGDRALQETLEKQQVLLKKLTKSIEASYPNNQSGGSLYDFGMLEFSHHMQSMQAQVKQLTEKIDQRQVFERENSWQHRHLRIKPAIKKRVLFG